MKTYSVTYRRDLGNDASLVEVGEMPDVCTYGRTLEEAAVNAREAVAVTADVSKSEVELEEHLAVGGVDVEELVSLRDRAQELHVGLPHPSWRWSGGQAGWSSRSRLSNALSSGSTMLSAPSTWC